MKNNQSGFSLLEGLLVLVVVGLIGFTGWYVYSIRQNSIPGVVNKPVVPTEPQGWQTFKSQKSNVQFSYPADWKLERTYTDEGYSLQGPNSFRIDYRLAKRDHSPMNVSCTPPSRLVSSQSLIGDYKLNAYSDPIAKNGEISEIQLGSEKGTPHPAHCRSTTFIDLPDDQYATLSGAYWANLAGKGIRGPYHYDKTAKGYMELAEVKTAIEIFKTFKQ